MIGEQKIFGFHLKNFPPDLPYNTIYDMMTKAGVKFSNQKGFANHLETTRKKGLWLYHLLEPQTWYKLLK